MAGYVALLRGINVGGNNKIPMADLKAMLTKLGLGDARTLLQSGNAVFTSDKSAGALEKLLEAETEKRFKAKIEYHVRGAKDFDAIVARNPFGEFAKKDPSHLLVSFFKAAPDAAQVKALKAAIKGPELVEIAGGREVYFCYPEGIGTSKLLPSTVDKLLGRGTGRNWNTVLKLQALLAA